MLSVGLGLTAAVPALAAPLQPQAMGVPNATTLSYEGNTFPLTQRDMVFHIGANKAGTTSMWLYYNDLSGNWNPCHDTCPPNDSVEWATLTHDHKADARIWHTGHRAFMDNGDVADFEWLYRTFPHSRFVMNVRSLKDWMVSRYDMVRAIRLGGGCSGKGTHDSCKFGWYEECAPQPIFNGAKCLRSKLTWTGNADEEMRGWIFGLAHVQKQQLAFFKSSREHMNRFVMADFCSDARTADSLKRLAWIQREDLTRHVAEHFVGLDDPLPVGLELEQLDGPHEIPHMLSDKHPGSSEKHIRELLMEWGCGDNMHDHIYIECADKMKSRGLKFFEAPKEAFPSSHHWMIHGRNLSAFPDGVEVIKDAHPSAGR